MKTLSTAILLAVPLAGASTLVAQKRQEACGADIFGYDAYCGSGTVCCPGTFINSCIPEGSTCCETGYYCNPGDSCWMDEDTFVTYCQAEDDPESSSVADLPDVYPTSDPDLPTTSSDDADEDDDDSSVTDDIGDEVGDQIDDIIDGDDGDEEDAAGGLRIPMLYALVGMAGAGVLML